MEILKGNARKIKIIEKNIGKNWREMYPDKSIDNIYRIAMKDDRAPLFCKISREQKQALRDMLEHYDTNAGDLVGIMIDTYYEFYINQHDDIIVGSASHYSGE
jgi:hypothetical protein